MSLIEIDAVVKSYGGLRPFRLRRLYVDPGEVVVISGLDRPAAAVLTDLLTATMLPDEGVVRIGGHSTAEVSGHDQWLGFLDRFGIVNDRVVLLGQLTVAANLAVPHSLAVDPMPAGVRALVERSAGEVGIDAETLGARLSDTPPLTRLRVAVGRAVAQSPAILIVEHPTLDLPASDVAAAGEVVRGVSRARGLATIVASNDARLGRLVATRRLEWRAAAGELAPSRAWRRWFA